MARISKERAVELIDLVFEANNKLGDGYNVGLEIEKWTDNLTVWMDREEEGINLFSYQTTRMGYKDENIMEINDQNLVKGEEHVRRLIAEHKEDK